MQTEKKREYDRNRQRQKYQEFRELKNHVCLDILGGACFTCGRTDHAEKFHLHHIEYDDEESNYPRNSKSQWTRVRRVREAQAHPERFKLLCPKCHSFVTNIGRSIARHDLDLDAFLALVYIEAELSTPTPDLITGEISR